MFNEPNEMEVKEVETPEVGPDEVLFKLGDYNQLEVTRVTGGRRSDCEVALRLIESGRVDVSEMVTHRFPLEDAAEAIEASASGEGIKVVVMPQGTGG